MWELKVTALIHVLTLGIQLLKKQDLNAQLSELLKILYIFLLLFGILRFGGQCLIPDIYGFCAIQLQHALYEP